MPRDTAPEPYGFRRGPQPIICARSNGLSVRDCKCMLAGDGFIECPPETRLPLLKLDQLGFATVAEFEAFCLAPIAQRSEQAAHNGRVAGSNPAGRTQPNYTGDICENCGGANMRRTGTCLQCMDCYETSGGCS